jgi:glycerophosphoryl diester phosphodiesterase
MNDGLHKTLQNSLNNRRNKPLAIAHRGASAWANENTLRAFLVAHSLGADMWEVDVHLTRDKVCVVCHDSNLLRVSGKDICLEKTDWNTIRKLPLLKGGTIPSFADVVSLALELETGLYVEVKGEGAGFAAWQEMKKQKFSYAILGSFKKEYVKELRDVNCDFPLSILIQKGHDPFLLALETGANIIHPCWENASPTPQELITQELLIRAQETGLEIVLWHEERPAVLEKIIQLPVLGICSNQPELLVNYPVYTDEKKFPKIVCHRGAETFAPENTLSAIDLAFDQGFNIVEIDVRQTKDGVPVVMHDSSVNRTTSGRGEIHKMSYAEVSQLDAGNWFDPFFAGEMVPRLEDVLIRSKGRGEVYIEIKEAEPKLLLELVQKFEMIEECFFWCNELRIMDQLRLLNKAVRLMARRYDFKTLEAAIKRHQPQVIEFNGLEFSEEDLARCRELGILSMPVYMGSGLDKLQKLIDSGADLLNLGHPELVKKILL